ncbi:alkaline phosphatase family protein [Streptomyces sp. NPDC057253]|uniref:alkaline phosphatase family protein n=1 Tax=Streptomyces sp. NPDC057253 TaxID=3346069 RepID=UPI003625BD15
MALPDVAAQLTGIDPLEVPREGLKLRSLSLEIHPVEYSIISTTQMFREAFEDLAAGLRGEGTIGPRRTGRRGEDAAPRTAPRGVSYRGSEEPVDVPDDFVERMVEYTLRFGAMGDIQEHADVLLGGAASNQLAVLFSILDIPAYLPRFLTASLENSLAMRVTLTVTDLQARGSASADVPVVGSITAAGELMVDLIEIRLYALFAPFFRRRPHPIGEMPDHPQYQLYRDEFTRETPVHFLTRFVTDIRDLDVDGLDASSDIKIALAEMLDKIPDEWDVERGMSEGVREFLETHRETLSTHAATVLLTIANRDHWLHNVRLDGPDALIETFDPMDETPYHLPPIPRALGQPIDGPMPNGADANLATIDHIVVVTMENRSYDHMLGFLTHTSKRIQPDGPRVDLDGLTGKERVPLAPGAAGRVSPTAGSDACFRPDPDHGFFSVRDQIGPGGEMDGFIPSFRRRLNEAREINQDQGIQGSLNNELRILGFQTAASVPVFQYIAREFAVLDRYFAAVPGPTQPNRVCMLTGRTPARTNSELTQDLGYLTDVTLFDLLSAARVGWRYYEGDIGFLRIFNRYRVDFERIRPLYEFLDGGSDPLPQVTFIDPNFSDVPSGDPAADDHPPANVGFGQAFLSRVLRRVFDSRSWPRTLLIITYDEHGGFYDHVPPPGTDAFSAANPLVAREVPRVHPQIAHYGVRVPALVVSPRIPRGAQSGRQIYDHTAIIRTILERFAPRQLRYTPVRVRRSRHLGELLTAAPRVSIPPPPQLLPPATPRGGPRWSAPNSAVQYHEIREDPEDMRVFLQRLGTPLPPAP